VKVERRLLHPVFKKTVRLSKKYHAHDEMNVAKTGDVVRIEETRPLSKLKRWSFVSKVDASKA
jgi:small subunit ribosomal protein S17